MRARRRGAPRNAPRGQRAQPCPRDSPPGALRRAPHRPHRPHDSAWSLPRKEIASASPLPRNSVALPESSSASPPTKPRPRQVTTSACSTAAAPCDERQRQAGGTLGRLPSRHLPPEAGEEKKLMFMSAFLHSRYRRRVKQPQGSLYSSWKCPTRSRKPCQVGVLGGRGADEHGLEENVLCKIWDNKMIFCVSVCLDVKVILYPCGAGHPAV